MKGVKYCGYQIALTLLKQKLTKIVNSKTQSQPFARNSFENLTIYDQIMNELKLDNQNQDHRNDKNLQTILGGHVPKIARF